jgi:hypothetical protein
MPKEESMKTYSLRTVPITGKRRGKGELDQ